MSPAERLFLPVLLVLKLFGYVRFFLGMLPGAAAAILLGVFAAWVCPRARRRLRARGHTQAANTPKRMAAAAPGSIPRKKRT